MILTWIANLQANTFDSTYIKDPYFQKLLKTNSQVPIFYNEQVRKQIGNYLKNLNNSTSILIGKTQYYQQLYGAYFDQAGIPKQLLLASAAFCNSDPLFVDPDGGSGMWSMSYAIAKKYKLRMHLDGARLLNALVEQKISPDEYVKDFNTVSFCFSKGMGCPLGSVLLGSEEDIWYARNLRKMLGGGMR